MQELAQFSHGFYQIQFHMHGLTGGNMIVTGTGFVKPALQQEILQNKQVMHYSSIVPVHICLPTYDYTYKPASFLR